MNGNNLTTAAVGLAMARRAGAPPAVQRVALGGAIQNPLAAILLQQKAFQAAGDLVDENERLRAEIAQLKKPRSIVSIPSQSAALAPQADEGQGGWHSMKNIVGLLTLLDLLLSLGSVLFGTPDRGILRPPIDGLINGFKNLIGVFANVSDQKELKRRAELITTKEIKPEFDRLTKIIKAKGISGLNADDQEKLINELDDAVAAFKEFCTAVKSLNGETDGADNGGDENAGDASK